MIGIVIIATNAYFVLGLRFVKRFNHFYRGRTPVKFHFFSDIDPRQYINENNIEWYQESHTRWTDGTNSKFSNILKIKNDSEWIYYFDADTNIVKEFTEDWFLGDMVAGEHYSNRGYTRNTIPYERNKRSKAYIPKDSPLRHTYYYGAFFGGKANNVRDFSLRMYENQMADRSWGYEPGVNDESFLNQHFHFNAPSKVVPIEEFSFVVSDKGGLGDTRHTDMSIEHIKNELLTNKQDLFDIQNGKLLWYQTT